MWRIPQCQGAWGDSSEGHRRAGNTDSETGEFNLGRIPFENIPFENLPTLVMAVLLDDDET